MWASVKAWAWATFLGMMYGLATAGAGAAASKLDMAAAGAFWLLQT